MNDAGWDHARGVRARSESLNRDRLSPSSKRCTNDARSGKNGEEVQDGLAKATTLGFSWKPAAGKSLAQRTEAG
jgi:hypothetical protein